MLSGYDFIFNRNIKGLITKYGGANSHMAIRCLELKIPAIIGLGPKNFDHIKNKKILEFDLSKNFYILLNENNFNYPNVAYSKRKGFQFYLDKNWFDYFKKIKFKLKIYDYDETKINLKIKNVAGVIFSGND